MTARVDHIVGPGETLVASDVLVSPGGKGANQALAARRMGADTVLVGSVGDDAFAMQALRLLRQAGVDLSRIQVVDRATGLAWVAVDRAGQNAITVIPGANAVTGAEALEAVRRLLGPRDTLVLQLEIPLETVAAAVNLARAAGARVLLDPAPAPSALPDACWQVDILTPNQGEAGQLLGGPAVRDVREAKAAARALRQRGPKVAVVKLGEAGVVWATAQGVFYLPAEPVTAVDSTGAGDAFAGALAARLDAGDPLPEAMRLANRAAAVSTTRRGAQVSFPDREEVAAWPDGPSR